MAMTGGRPLVPHHRGRWGGYDNWGDDSVMTLPEDQRTYDRYPPGNVLKPDMWMEVQKNMPIDGMDGNTALGIIEKNTSMITRPIICDRRIPIDHSTHDDRAFFCWRRTGIISSRTWKRRRVGTPWTWYPLERCRKKIRVQLVIFDRSRRISGVFDGHAGSYLDDE